MKDMDKIITMATQLVAADLTKGTESMLKYELPEVRITRMAKNAVDIASAIISEAEKLGTKTK